ncbi:MAG: hypothetical protein JSR62_07345 [Nitrospira sp.]|nr:hypothetical protein [Nitrospira sp.]
MAGSSRIGAVILVTVLSCLVLGGVWGLVMLLLPQSEVLPETAPTVPPLPSPSPAVPPVSTVPDAAPSPAVMQAEVPLVVQDPPRPSPAERGGNPAARDAKCDLEISALCPEEAGARHACLQRKAAQLSLPCRPMLREKLVRMKESLQQLRVACEADRRQYCRDVPAGGEGLVQCLESHAQSVSDQCFQLLPKRGRLLN